MIIKKFKVNKKKKYEKIKNHEETRKYGLDLLKIIAMINIINLHINGFLSYTTIDIKSLKFKPIYRLEAFSYWPVDAFGLISGIVGYKKYKFMNMIYLWFIAEFYSLFFSVILYYQSKIGQRDLFLSFFPLGLRRNWYVNGYIFMYYFLPFVTNSISSINKMLYGKIVFHFFFIYSIYYTIIKYNIQNAKANFDQNFNFIGEGYSSFWLLILFIIGGYIGKYFTYKNIILNIVYLLIYLISSLITSEYIFYSIRKYNVKNSIFLSYNSPTVILQALSLALFFNSITINNKYLIKVISFLYPLNFSVNIIHTRFFFSKVQSSLELFKYIKSLTPENLFFKIYGVSIKIYFVCVFVDYIRSLIFKTFKIRTICFYIEKLLF